MTGSAGHDGGRIGNAGPVANGTGPTAGSNETRPDPVRPASGATAPVAGVARTTGMIRPVPTTRRRGNGEETR
ncbi:hypothetical protein [Pseudonocardia endophytica]|uniref:Uncharacterized protein n=1 Tax=Pseudonocardia endophytica TaxID=401976 RepID=A0A4R1HNR9_PSEEN|nr:hypothetical protein [Pseudonocardia endophytica]TCK22763.1 hypothetical protein EV378_6771 [Pseudonocardia endophytica]